MSQSSRYGELIERLRGNWSQSCYFGPITSAQRALIQEAATAIEELTRSETGPSEEDIERMLDNAACAAQEGRLLRDTDGTETPLREAVRLNVVNPLLRRSERYRRMDAKQEVLAAKINYEMCKALTPAYAWRESAADTILQGLFKRVLEDDKESRAKGGLHDKQ